jgi:hypothetical protein
MRANMTQADFDVRSTDASQYPVLAMAGIGSQTIVPGDGTITLTVNPSGIIPTVDLALAVIIYG